MELMSSSSSEFQLFLRRSRPGGHQVISGTSDSVVEKVSDLSYSQNTYKIEIIKVILLASQKRIIKLSKGRSRKGF